MLLLKWYNAPRFNEARPPLVLTRKAQQFSMIKETELAQNLQSVRFQIDDQIIDFSDSNVPDNWNGRRVLVSPQGQKEFILQADYFNRENRANNEVYFLQLQQPKDTILTNNPVVKGLYKENNVDYISYEYMGVKRSERLSNILQNNNRIWLLHPDIPGPQEYVLDIAQFLREEGGYYDLAARRYYNYFLKDDDFKIIAGDKVNCRMKPIRNNGVFYGVDIPNTVADYIPIIIPYGETFYYVRTLRFRYKWKGKSFRFGENIVRFTKEVPSPQDMAEDFSEKVPGNNGEEMLSLIKGDVIPVDNNLTDMWTHQVPIDRYYGNGFFVEEGNKDNYQKTVYVNERSLKKDPTLVSYCPFCEAEAQPAQKTQIDWNTVSPVEKRYIEFLLELYEPSLIKSFFFDSESRRYRTLNKDLFEKVVLRTQDDPIILSDTGILVVTWYHYKTLLETVFILKNDNGIFSVEEDNEYRNALRNISEERPFFVAVNAKGKMVVVGAGAFLLPRL